MSNTLYSIILFRDKVKLCFKSNYFKLLNFLNENKYLKHNCPSIGNHDNLGKLICLTDFLVRLFWLVTHAFESEDVIYLSKSTQERKSECSAIQEDKINSSL